MLVVNLNESPSLLRNDLQSDAGWLKVELQARQNRSAIGSQVTAHYGERRQVQAVVAQSSFYSVDDQRLHFGLGDADRADLEIRWPDGSTETLDNIPAGRWITVRQGEGVIASRKLPEPR